MDKLVVEGLRCCYGARQVLSGVSLRVPVGGFVGLIGPNGSGKSTLLKTVYRALTPEAGLIAMDGVDTRKLSCKALARKMAVVGQENAAAFNFTVREIVAMGRTPYKRLFEPDDERDDQAIENAMAKLGVTALAGRAFSRLSGGEKQRVIIARAFAQETDFLVLDEPTNALDVCFQMQILEELAASGKTVLAAIHDLNLASLFCSDLYVLNQGGIALHGSPKDILTRETIRDIFGVRCRVDTRPDNGEKNIIYLPTMHHQEGIKP